MKLPGLYQTFEEKWGKFQTCHIISDTHFGDMDLKENIPNRPNDDDFIKLINSKVGRADIILHLGDVGNIDCVRRLRAARKILIMGNHDAGRTNYERAIKLEKFDVDKYTRNEVKEIMADKYPGWKIDISESYDVLHAPFHFWAAMADNMLFDEVYEGALIVGEKLILSHEPIMGLTWAMNLHGHVHDKRAKTDAYHINCCSDVIGYEPINLTQKLKQGIMSRIVSIHRQTIDRATERKARRRTHSTNTVKNCQTNNNISYI